MKPDISFWEQETFFAPQNIIIVGGGFLGLWSALELITQKPTAKITILEKGIIPTGASTRNAGFACFGSPTEMIADAKRMGDDKMWKIVELRYRGIEKIRTHFEDHIIDLDHCGGYECFLSSKGDLRELNDKLYWLNAGMQKITGSANSFAWCNNKIEKFGFEGFNGMIENTLEGGLHSGKLLQALTKKVQSLGVQILTGIEVYDFEKIQNEIHVQTSLAVIKAEHLLICTNAFSSKLIKDFCIEPARGQVLVTEPIDGLKMKGTFHFDEGYYYFRNVGDRILIGGARNTDFEAEHTDEIAVNENIQTTLENFISKHLLPKTKFKIDYRWSGIMGFSENKLPVIKQVDENIYAAIACNGMGVALSPVMAEQIARTIYS